MLAALFLATIAVAAFAPIVMTGAEESDDATGDETDPAAQSGGQQLLDAGQDHEIAMAEGVESFSLFEPGEDHLTVTHVPDDATAALMEDTSGFVLTDGDTAQSFLFPELDRVPTEDVTLWIEGEDGAEPSPLTLAELLEDQAMILQPDPGTPTVPTGESLTEPPLAPITDEPSIPTGETLTDDPLEPIVDDPILAPVTAAATLPDPDVTEIWLDLESGEPTVAEVAEFVPEEDLLRVNYLAGNDPAPELSVTASWDGTDGVVSADGEIIALLRGAPDASLSDVELIAHAALAPSDA